MHASHLLQESLGFLLGQHSQTRRGLQDHGGATPRLLGDRLLGDLQQLPDGVAALQRRQEPCFIITLTARISDMHVGQVGQGRNDSSISRREISGITL